MSNQIITLASVGEADGSFNVSGVFWLTAPANNVQPAPTFRSAVPGAALADLAALRAGTLVEQAFTTTPYASGTTQATVDADLQTKFTAAQNALNNANPALATAAFRAFNGASWAALGLAPPTLPLGNFGVPVMLDVPAATAYGFLPGITVGRATGFVSTSGTGAVKVLETTYTPQASGAQRSIVSTSASDAAAGTGARTVKLTYLTLASALKTETITLNGTTAVNTANTDICFVESLVVVTAGTAGGSNVGTISLMSATAGGGSVVASIAASDNQTQYAHHYVPAGVTCYILNVAIGSSGATAVAGRGFLTRQGDPSSSTSPGLVIGGQYPHLAGASEDHVFAVPYAVPGPDRIVLNAVPSAATASNAFGTFEYIQF